MLKLEDQTKIIDSLQRSTIVNTTTLLKYKCIFTFKILCSDMTEAIIDASLSLYKSVLANLLPTPEKCHYVFNLRDFAQVIKGT